MYEAYFQFRERPFAATPQADRFFAGQGFENTRQTLKRIVARAEGAGLIIGPSGTGKTLVCQWLAAEFADQLSVALLSSGRICTRRALLQAILFELRLPYRGMEEGELRLSLIDHLTPGHSTPRPEGQPGLLLLVDEAHTLPIRLLEELRMITNLVRDGQPRVRLVLAGSPALEERFASPKLDSFSQRLAARCYLSALGREETAGYARYQIGAVGGDPDRVFDGPAYEAIYRATDGIPRLINQVCDHALILTALGQRDRVTAAAIEEAWSDLQQLPTPWQPGGSERDARPGVVEFAPLDDLPEEAAAIPFPAPRPPHVAATPDEQLERIEQQLAAIEEDFQPAGSIGPQVELVFSQSIDPFGEAFDDEEVVIDRYASLEANVFAQRPTVRSQEGSELSQLLTPWMTAAESPRHIDAATAGQAADEPATDRVAEPAAAALSVELGDDDDLIIIEDEAPAERQTPAPVLVRRQEYRQLFTRLRRG